MKPKLSKQANQINVLKMKRADVRWERRQNQRKRPISKNFEHKLAKYGFFDSTDFELRLKIAVDVLMSYYQYSTAQNYFDKLKTSGLLGDVRYVTLDESIFMNRPKFEPQVRLPEFDKFETFVTYLFKLYHDNAKSFHEIGDGNYLEPLDTNTTAVSKLRLCILSYVFCYFTALRRNSILSLTNEHLSQLLQRKPVLQLPMKYSNEWTVYYHTGFCNFLSELAIIYQNYLKLPLIVPLFRISAATVITNLHKCYALANDIEIEDPYTNHSRLSSTAPSGFGTHVFRVNIATKLADGNLAIAQEFLGHKYRKTTQQYVRSNVVEATRKMKQLEDNGTLFRIVNDAFSPKSSSIASEV